MMGMMGLGLIVPLILIGLVAYALGWRPQFNQSPLVPTSQTPLEILKTRYAGGEISREEYEQIQQDLEGRATSCCLSEISKQVDVISDIYLLSFKRSFTSTDANL
jgi:putative membrane protein